MAKAKNKPCSPPDVPQDALRRALADILYLDKRTLSLATMVARLEKNDQRIKTLEEAICPRVAARLSQLEANRAMIQAHIDGLNREHNKLCKVVNEVVNDNADKSDRLAARLDTLEREPAPRTSGPGSGYEGLYRDIFAEEPTRRSNHLSMNERYLVTNIVAIASGRMTRAARHELIVRLTDLNKGI